MSELFRLIERRSGLANPAPWLVDAFGGLPSKSGVRVTPDTALALSAVYACVQVRGQTLAALPLKLFNRQSNGDKLPALNHPLYRLLSASPHPELTRFEFIEMMSAHLDLRGNCYAQIVRNNAGQIVRLVPLHPDRVRVIRLPDVDPATGLRPLVYDVTNVGFGGTVRLDASQILHVRELSGDGLVGWSRIRIACESIGVGLAADEHAARMFSNGARPAGVLEHPNKLNEAGAANLRKSWEAIHGGVANSGKVAVLEEGMKFHEIGLSNEDAQLLETRKFTRTEIASIFRVPIHLIGGDDKASTYASVEQFNIQFVQNCMLPSCVRWEQRLSLSLLSAEEQGKFFFAFNLAGILRGDMSSRYSAYRVGLGRAGEPGWITINDIRETEDMNRIAGGDKLFSGLDPQVAKTARTALEPLLTDALARAFRKEAKAIRAILKKPLGERAAELDTFYADHRRHLIETVLPVFTAARSLSAPLDSTPEALADAIVHESRTAPFVQGEEEKTLTTWETTRAATTAVQTLS